MTLQDLIRHHIRQEGIMPLDIFQQWALYHPEKGYYNTQAIFGSKGDFITAPETSQMFGEIVGLWLLDLWHQMGSPPHVQLIELGPGRGTLMADILRTSRLDPSFLKALCVHLVEISPLLKKEQQKRLSHFPVVWSSTLEEALCQESGPLFLVANEFFDAIPTKQYEKKEGLWRERFVGWCEKDQAFYITLGAPLDLIEEGPDGAILEISPERERLFLELTQQIKKRQGVLWISDYGYSSAINGGDSLQGIYRQQKSNPLAHVGESDLSSHVNFGIFKEIARSQSIADSGPKGQGSFLKNLGIDQRLAQLKQGKSLEICARLQADFERLTHFLQMGLLFQVYAAYHPGNLKPCGF